MTFVVVLSIITRFIVRMNAFIHKTLWRSGVVLKQGGNTALVKADTEDRKIFIWVSGDEPTRRDFLAAIRTEFEAIHKTIVKIEATEKVPIPGYPNVEPLNFAFLLQAEREGRATLPAMAGDRLVDVNVREVLNGVSPESARPWIDKEQRLEQAVPAKTQEPIQTETKAENMSPSIKSKNALTTILTWPKHIGRFVLDIFGRGDKAAESSAIILGWFILVGILLAIGGFIQVDGVLRLFENVWRFFFPVK